MHRRHLLTVLAALAAAGARAGDAAPPEARTGIAACTVTVPQGDYALVTLTFSVQGAPKRYQEWTYVGGLRGGRMRMDDGVGLREPGGWLELKDGKLAGSFRRNNSLSTSSTHLDWVAPQQVAVEATVQGGAISGSARIGEASGTVTGTLVAAAALATRNAVAAERSWPSAHGPVGGGMAAQATGVATIDAVTGLRQVWRCEEGDLGQGLGSITRFMHQWKNASGRRAGTGADGPVVADGRLYLSYFVPAPRPADVPEKANLTYPGTETQLAAALLAQAKTEGWTGAELPTYAAEKVWQCADDVVVCMDAATGQTRWKAVIKGRGVNVQHHKSGPFDMSPAVGGGKVFAYGMSGWLYAFDAATGKPLWEIPAVRSPLAELKVDGSCSLLVADGVLVGPAGSSWGGYDAETGKPLWKAGGRSVSTLVRWANGGREHLIGRMGLEPGGKGLTCVEAKTGKVLWSAPVEVRTGGRGLGPGGICVAGDRLLVYRLKSAAGAKAAGGDDEDGGKDKVDAAIACFALSPSGVQPQWEVDGGTHGESVPVVVHGKYVFSADLRVIDLATGKVLGQAQGPMPGNGGYMQVIEDLVLVRTDGTHGGIRFGFYKVAPDGAVRLLNADGKEWSPPFGGGTTSYHHPICYPLVDGRMFLRQQDGVYCWDVRAKTGG